ncbi:helix-turn-helix transcriptional regulator [Streptomyces capparidis]
MVRRRRLGLELKRLRESAGLTGAELAKRLNWSASKLSRFEAGRAAPSSVDVNRLLDELGVKDAEQREKLATLTRDARKKGWWQLYDVPYSTFIGLEAEATTLLTYENVVPGLLQTRRYAEEINRATVLGLSDDALEQRVDVRMQRQHVVTGPERLELRAVLDESALRRMVGGPEVMREQCNRLLEMAELPNVILQVIPFSAGAHPGTLAGPFVILKFPHQEDPDVAYVEASPDPYQPDPQGYEVLFDHLRAAALSVTETLTLIRNMVNDL